MDGLFSINVAQAVFDDAPSIQSYLEKILGFVLSIAGGIAILAIVISGVMYLTSAGDRDRVKQARAGLTYSIIGLVVILLSYAIVKTVADQLAQ